VTIERGGSWSFRADSGRHFERWLVNTGSGHIPPDLLQYVNNQMATPRADK
jgi:hypothetical protein